MKILVTGASGFLGSHLCDRLLSHGHHVTGLDNHLTGHVSNLADAMAGPNFTLVERDVMAEFDGEFDQIYHLASPASPPMYQKEPIETAKINFIGTLNMLELAERCGARILLASTSETYGDPLVHPQQEDYCGNVNQCGPRACYDEGKRIAETLAFDFNRTRGVDIRVVRIFNTYGPRMNPLDGRVVSNFIDQAFGGRDITLYGDGSQTRSFCHYKDLIEGFERMMAAENTIGPINLGNPEEITIGTLAEHILDLTKSNARLVTVPLPQDDPKRRCPDISLATELLGWTPKIPLAQGLAETVAYFRQLREFAAE